MEILNLIQGTQEWHDARSAAFTASTAPSMMGQGYDSRDAAMRQVLGIDNKFISETLQKMFDQGHQAEADARPAAEEYTGLILSPLVGRTEIEGMTFLASFDGIDFDQSLVWEHKHTGKNFEAIPALYYWQLEHQMMVAGCEKAVLSITNRNTGEVTHYNYQSRADRRGELLIGWKQWKEDIAHYERSDSEWLDAAENYRDLNEVITSLTKQRDHAKATLQKLAGNQSACGAGVRVGVTFISEKKQTAAAYVKEHDFELPMIQLNEPVIVYRVTIAKGAEDGK